MATGDNNIHDLVNQAVGRNATPYEVEQFSKAPIQDLANLKGYYSGLNKDTSIVDYLKYTGQDSLMPNRQTLGQQYGITNVGTAEGNIALLNKLKGGNPPAASPIGGTITPDATKTIIPGSVSTNTTSPNITETRTNAKGNPYTVQVPNPNFVSTPNAPTVDGSVSGAAALTTPEAGTSPIDTNPDVIAAKNTVSSTLKDYQTSQSHVADIDTQVMDLRKTIRDMQSEAEQEAASAGGVISRADIAAQVAFKSKEIQNQIAGLLDQRSVYAASQAQTATQLTQARQDLKEAQTLALSQEKLDVQQTQFAQNLEQKGWKQVKMNVYDEYGSVVGQKSVWTQNPSDKTGFDANGNQVQIAQGSQGAGVSSSAPAAPVSPLSAPDTMPMITSGQVDVTIPGYTTAMVVFNGKNTQMTQSYIDQTAIAGIINGGVLPSSAQRGTKGLPLIQSTAIKDRMGQLDPGGNLALNKAEAQAWGSSLTTQIGYAVQLNRALTSAEADLNQVLETFTSKGINDFDSPISNFIANAAKYGLGSGDVSAFKASLTEISRLYAQVFSMGGSVQGTNEKAAQIMDGNISIANLKQVNDQLQALGKIDVQKANDAVTQIEQKYRSIVPGAAPQAEINNLKTQVDNAGYNYDDMHNAGYSDDDIKKALKIP